MSVKDIIMLVVFAWELVGVQLVLYNIQGVAKQLVDWVKKPVTIIKIILWVPVWWIAVIILSFIYPALYIRRYWLKKGFDKI